MPQAAMKLSARFVVPLLLLILFLARIASTYAIFSETSDEHHHIYWGMDWFERGEYLGGDGFQPPFPRAVVAVLPYLWGFRAENSWIVHEWENQTLDDFWTSLTLARTGNLFFAIAVFLAVYWWSRRLLGERSAWAACGLLVCKPDRHRPCRACHGGLGGRCCCLLGFIRSVALEASSVLETKPARWSRDRRCPSV